MDVEKIAEFLRENVKEVSTIDDVAVRWGDVKEVLVNLEGSIVIRHEHGRIDLRLKPE